MLPVARMGDKFTDDDNIKTGSSDVFINGLPVARMGDLTTGHTQGSCTYGSVVITTGSSTVFVNGLPIARMGDKHVEHCCSGSCHDAVISSASGDVFSG